MQKKNMSDTRICLTLLVEYINNQTSRLDLKFGDDELKVQYLRRSALRMSWAKPPLSLITEQHYSFRDLYTALHEAIQLIKEVDEPSDTFFGQYTLHPRDVRKHGEAGRQLNQANWIKCAPMLSKSGPICSDSQTTRSSSNPLWNNKHSMYTYQLPLMTLGNINIHQKITVAPSRST